MKESFRSILPEQVKIGSEGSQGASYRQTEGHFSPITPEGLHHTVKEIRRHLYSRPSESSMLREIRDLIDDITAVRAKFNESFNRKREEALTASRGENITLGGLLLGLLLGFLSAPAAWAEETIEDAKRQADQAA
jgi:hypothetical protein